MSALPTTRSTPASTAPSGVSSTSHPVATIAAFGLLRLIWRMSWRDFFDAIEVTVQVLRMQRSACLPRSRQPGDPPTPANAPWTRSHRVEAAADQTRAEPACSLSRLPCPENQPLRRFLILSRILARLFIDIALVIEHLAVPDDEHDRVVVDITIVVELDDPGDTGKLLHAVGEDLPDLRRGVRLGFAYRPRSRPAWRRRRGPRRCRDPR